MMTLHTLFAGTGYTYLTDSVATGDRPRLPGQSLSNYYASEKGTPPGEWTGAGIKRLEINGTVTEAQMLALFGEGRHPNADEIIAASIKDGATARKALKKSQIGRLFADNIKEADPMLDQIDEAVRVSRAKNGGTISDRKYKEITLEIASQHFKQRFPEEKNVDAKKIMGWVKATRDAQGDAVAGFDLVFTPQKSVTTLWGIGSEDLQKDIENAHREAVSETLEWVESNVSFSRKGAGGVIRVEGEGLTIARFDHFDNRAGDPNLHTHCAVANKIYCPDDGKWRSLDGRAMFQMNVAASNLYNQTLTNKLRNKGLSFRAVSHGENKSPVYEVAGVPDSLLKEFSRRDDIERRLEELVDDFRARNKREPSWQTQIKLAQQATLETRGVKQDQQSLTEMRALWAQRAEKILGTSDVSALVTGLVNEEKEHTEVLDMNTAADRTLELLERRRSQWNVTNIYSAATETLAVMRFNTTDEQRAMIESVMQEVRDGRSIRLTGQQFENVSGLTTTKGKSLFHQSMSDKFTSPETIFREQQLLDATRIATPFVATRRHIDAVISAVEKENGFPLNEGQRTMAHWLLGSGAQLSVAVGPAGAGKTTSMKVVSDAWQAMGNNVIGLGPSAAAANVLGNDLGIAGQTIASILTRDKHGLDTGITRGTLIIVDEAGMASTRDLYQLNEIAQRQGAVVRMIGDPSQLSAVESGGMLELLAQETNAPSLEEVVRFKTEGEAEASLKIREGEHDSYDFYDKHDRINTGSSTALREGILNEWAAETADGKTSLMMATTRKDVALLNTAAQQRRLNDGFLAPLTAEIVARDGATLHAGDQIVTRKNDSTINLVGGKEDGRRIFNGDLWTVNATDAAGNLHVSHKENGGRAVLPAAYVRAHVELGYASTVHRAQGMTVDTAHMLISGHESKELAYVGLSRGKMSNKAWIVTEQTVDPEAEHDKKTPANARAVWEQIMNRGSDNKAALSMLSDSSAEEDRAVELESYNHIRETMIRSWSTHLLNIHAPEVISELDDDDINSIAQAVSNALNAGIDVDVEISACRDSETFVDDLTAALTRVEATMPVGILPPQGPGVDTELLEWARTNRVALVDQRRLNADRLVAMGEGLTPHRVADVSAPVLNEQRDILRARLTARSTIIEKLEAIHDSLREGEPHMRLQNSHAHTLHQDRLISTVLNLDETASTAYGSRQFQIQREIAALEKQLPSREQWGDIQLQAHQARTDIAQAIHAERTLALSIHEQLQAARFDHTTLTTALSVIGDELDRRSTLTAEEAEAERSKWGTADAGLTVATAVGSYEQRAEQAEKARKSVPETTDVTQMLLNAPDLSTAPDSIAARLQLALTDLERSAVNLARPDRSNKEREIDMLIAERRELESQLTTVISATADPVESDADTRARIRQVQAAEPTILHDIEVLSRQVQAAKKYAAELPPEPKGLFVSAKKKQDITNRHAQAQKQIREAQSALDRAKGRHDNLLSQVPDRSLWPALLSADSTQHQSREQAALIRNKITDLDSRIAQARAGGSGQDGKQFSRPDAAPRQHTTEADYGRER